VNPHEPDEREAAEWGLMQALGVDDPQKIHAAIEALKARIAQLEHGSNDPVVYLLWSGKHEAWWAPYARGYTTAVENAGRYTRDQAVQHVVQSALCGVREQVTSMVAAPDNWG
jgi:hypothetical protein